jgi:hypothetical protein
MVRQALADALTDAASGILKEVIASEVGSGTERVAGAGEQHRAHFRIGIDGCGGCAQIFYQREAERIELVGAVERHAGDASVLLEQECVEFHGHPRDVVATRICQRGLAV